jgi:glycosyltransferase involved in cell wall biosynthesis
MDRGVMPSDGPELDGSVFRGTVVIPAYNEEGNVGSVVRAARQAGHVKEVLVIDDGSNDGTAGAAREAGAQVVRHAGNEGKGSAMERGCREATHEALVFLDGDLRNVTPTRVQRILEPLADGFDFVKTRFDRRSGRVTELTAKPLLGHFFPEISASFDQPLSGQIGIRKGLLEKLDLEPDMGVDIGILIDAVECGVRATEVYFGFLEHEPRDLDQLDETARAVSRVILERAARYDRIESAIETIQAGRS